MGGVWGLLMIDARAVRSKSELEARRMGYSINPALPLLEPLSIVRSKDDVVDRLLVLGCVVAIAHGSRKEVGLPWLEREGLAESLTAREREWIASLDENDRRIFRAQEESAWALMWALGFVARLDFDSYCEPTLARMFPSIRNGEGSARFREQSRLRSESEIVDAIDLAFCVHWAVRDASLRRTGLPNDILPYVIAERRRALEWLTTPVNWDDVTFDT